jgi:TonB family protein
MLLENRVKYSFLISLSIHIMVIFFFGYISIKEKHARKLITDIDIIEPFIPSVAPALKEEKPKNIWEFMKMALPTLKKADVPVQKEEKPLDIVKKDIEKALEVERKLVDKNAPIIKRPDSLSFKEIQKEKDQKLADIMKTMDNKKLKELIEQERILTDREDPAVRRSDPLKFDEVGLKRAENIKDILPTTARGKNNSNQNIRDLTPADLLTDRRQPIEKTVRNEDLGIKLKTRVKDDGRIKEIVGTADERKKVRELLAITEKLVENSAKIAPKSGEKKPVIGYGGNGGINLKNEDLKKIETKINIVPIKKTETTSAMEKNGGSKPAIELVGPLQGRGIIASYMPKYPEWMKEKGLEADVAVRFFVAPNGVVKEEMSIERTSGYSELDKTVMAVLKTWQFEELLKSVKQDSQWGVVTFRFRLRG